MQPTYPSEPKGLQMHVIAVSHTCSKNVQPFCFSSVLSLKSLNRSHRFCPRSHHKLIFSHHITPQHQQHLHRTHQVLDTSSQQTSNMYVTIPFRIPLQGSLTKNEERANITPAEAHKQHVVHRRDHRPALQHRQTSAQGKSHNVQVENTYD